MALERARERVVHKYYRSWLESPVGYRVTRQTDDSQSLPRLHLDGTPVRDSNDTALISFAQLGCLRLCAKRGIVTLLSTTRQYILAEATKTTSLNRRHDNHDQDDELWFGNASLPRSEGISEHALTPDLYTAIGGDGARYAAPALVINDIAVDSRFSHHGYAGNGVNFYCGVPIITPSGFPIGVYTITDDKPRKGLAPEELRFMQDMAMVVMDHLDAVQNDAARSRGEKMILGLGHFVQGGSTTLPHPKLASDDLCGPESPPVHSTSENVQSNVPRFKGMTITSADPAYTTNFDHQQEGDVHSGQQTMNTLESPVVQSHAKHAAKTGLDGEPKTAANPKSTTLMLDHNNLAHAARSSQSHEVEQAFSRAANILRECAAADGVVFFDALSHNFAKGSERPGYDAEQQSGRDADARSRSRHGNTSSDRSSEHSARSTSISSGLSDDSKSMHVLSSKGKRSGLLGYALDISKDSTATATTVQTLGLSEQSLRRLIRRYPHGKMFYFSEDGKPHSDLNESATSSESGGLVKRRVYGSNEERKTPRSILAVATDLLEVVPGARSIMFLPLWDFSKRRWSAGTFLWSRQPERLLDVQEDLVYLRTFGHCIMNEIARLEAVSSDAVRTTFVANISHELRTPLHGILGSIEVLQDTRLDAFQSSMTTAVETCGKTLLETLDHVLEYAKINNLSKSRWRKRGSGKSRSKDGKKTEHAVESNFDVAAVVEEVIEAVCAGQTFGSTKKLDMTLAPEGVDSTKTPEAIRTDIEKHSIQSSSAIRILLNIQKRDSWWVSGQPGAIRRIVMNLVGNSLKYTKQGTITVSLSSSTKSSMSRNLFCLTVADTGIGMTPGFLRNHAFAAFTQENRFSTGAGLGLSIVQQIVDSLGGKIEVSSEEGVGTEVKIWLAFPHPLNYAEVELDDLVDRVAPRTTGQTLCLISPRARQSEEVSQLHRTVGPALRAMIEDWFGMRVVTAPSMEDVTADFFLYAEPPPIRYLLEHHGIHARNVEVPVIVIATNAFESSALLADGINELTDLGRIVEVTAQPCGPHKFAKVLHRAMSRLAFLARDTRSQQSTGPVDTNVVEDDRVLEPYLGDSDSYDPVQPRLARDHDDHPQPGAVLAPDGKVDQHSYERPDLTEPTASVAQRDGSDASQGGVDSSQLSQVPLLSTTPTSPHSRIENDLPRANTVPSPQTISNNAGRILLVDDNEINLQLLVAFVKKANRPYETAKDGLEALAAYKQAASSSRFAHVLMDVSMPLMDGILSTREIRRFEKKEGMTPANIIAVTGQATEATKEEMFKAGGDQFVTKPVKFKELMELLKGVE